MSGAVPAAAVEAAMRAWGVSGEDQRRIVRSILGAAVPHIRAQTAEVIANGLQAWGGVSERAYVEGFAEAAWGKVAEGE